MKTEEKEKLWKEADKMWDDASKLFADAGKMFRETRLDAERIESVAETTVTTLRLSGGRWTLFWRLLKSAFAALWCGRTTVCIRKRVTKEEV